MRLSAQVKSDGDDAEVYIYLDREGLADLLQQLGHLGKTDHIHLFSPSWGGNDLTEEPLKNGHQAVQHIKVYLRMDGEVS